QMIPIDFTKQIIPRTFEFTLNYLIDNYVNTSIFDNKYNNDETGAPAYDPGIMLKIILFCLFKRNNLIESYSSCLQGEYYIQSFKRKLRA
ncbi:MAG: hypothetical protein SVO01_11615, partial [Thermotogota bacterium]|nr:hypothetical protein [Thermotogota bacterium]